MLSLCSHDWCVTFRPEIIFKKFLEINLITSSIKLFLKRVSLVQTSTTLQERRDGTNEGVQKNRIDWFP